MASRSEKSPRHIRLNLLANGLDFIREGIEALYGADAGSRKTAPKYALLHVFSGTLLVLKERLRRGHPSLIFKDVADSPKLDPKTKEERVPKTVDFDEVLRRLEGAVGVAIAQTDRETLRKVQEERNRLEHYDAQLDLSRVDSLVGQLVDFLERFLHDELQEPLLSHLSTEAGGKVGALKSIAERARERRLAEWTQRAERRRHMTDEQLAALRAEYDNVYEHPKHGPDRALFTCPNCGSESVGVVDGDVGVCTESDCREIHMISRCSRCSCETLSEGGLCGDCDWYTQKVLGGG